MKLLMHVEGLLVFGFPPLPSVLKAMIFRNLVPILTVTQSTQLV